MASQPKIRLTPEEYLALERKADYRSEFFNGEVFAMSGASRNHNLISANALSALHAQLRNRPCEVYASDMRVKVAATGLYTYPDVIVVCDTPLFDDEQKDTLLNPSVIIEVLSKSNEAYDRGEKFEQYRALTSLADYILISQDKYHIERFFRLPDNQWLLSEAKNLEDTIRLISIECDLKLKEIYEKVEMTKE
jgi:Uma2 family endonuclease